jgi:myo-inositol-1(or 4)-monophosphatase
LPHRGRGSLAEFRTEFAAVQEQVAGLRRFGSAALDLAFVAAGRVDIYWERNLSSWDMAAGILLVREAGGYISDCDGADAMFAKGHIVAGNETLQRELLKILKASKPPSS